MLEEIKNIICDYAIIDPNDITESSKLRYELELNSLDLVNISVDLERKFGVSFETKKFLALKTVGDIINYIKSLES